MIPERIREAFFIWWVAKQVRIDYQQRGLAVPAIVTTLENQSAQHLIDVATPWARYLVNDQSLPT